MSPPTSPSPHSKHALRQHSADSLAKGYSSGFRKVEIASLLSYAALMGGLVYKLAPHAAANPWLVVTAVLLGYLAADFVSGFVHWMGDTWGTVDTPVLGKSLIRPFREHHVDQLAITRHDFVETNGANCLISLPVALIALLIPVGEGAHQTTRLFAASFLGALILWVMATNQFHKWSHEEKPPLLIGWLQKAHLVLPPGHHAIHHTPPFATYYCITVGWLNWPLHKLGFFRAMERLVTGTLGWLPRQDDLGTEAALAVHSAGAPTSTLPADEAKLRTTPVPAPGRPRA